MTELQQYLDERLASVVLWDVKGETSTLVMAGWEWEVKELAKYIEDHGYSVTVGPESYMGLRSIQVKRL